MQAVQRTASMVICIQKQGQTARYSADGTEWFVQRSTLERFEFKRVQVADAERADGLKLGHVGATHQVSHSTPDGGRELKTMARKPDSHEQAIEPRRRANEGHAGDRLCFEPTPALLHMLLRDDGRNLGRH